MAEEKTWEQKLSEIRSMDVASLTDADKEFLIARRSHLNADELVRFADILPEDETEGEKPLEKFTKPELIDLAGTMGIEVGDLNKADLIAAIRQQQEVQAGQ